MNTLGTGKNANIDGKEGTKKGKPPHKKATKASQIKTSQNKGDKSHEDKLDTLLGDPIANTKNIQGDKVCYTPLKDKCDAISNLKSPKTLRQTRAFCEMVNFLSSFLPNLRRLLILIYDLQKKAKKFKWTDEAKKDFKEIKKLLVCLPVLKAPTPDGLFRLNSDTLRDGVGGTLFQKQGDEVVVIGYHSKRLPKSAKNLGITELGLTGLLVNIHSFM